MTASPTVLEQLTDEQFDHIRLLVAAAVADCIAAERDLAIVNGELRRIRSKRVALGVSEPWVIGL